MGERFKREGTHVYSWLIHAVVQQKTTQHCKAIILQLKKEAHVFHVGASRTGLAPDFGLLHRVQAQPRAQTRGSPVSVAPPSEAGMLTAGLPGTCDHGKEPLPVSGPFHDAPSPTVTSELILVCVPKSCPPPGPPWSCPPPGPP